MGHARWGLGYRTQKAMTGEPACPACKGRLISAVVSFGDPLPEKELMLASQHARHCDLMLVLPGAVTSGGDIQGSVGRGPAQANVMGRLSERTGSGTWAGSGSLRCAGQWRAEKRA